MTTKLIGFQSVTIVIQSINKKCCRVEMGSLPRKVAVESMNYEDYGTLAIY